MSKKKTFHHVTEEKKKKKKNKDKSSRFVARGRQRWCWMQAARSRRSC